MNAVSTVTGSIVLPYRLLFSDRRLYVYVTLFVAFAVSIPWACHKIHPGAGPTVLPRVAGRGDGRPPHTSD